MKRFALALLTVTLLNTPVWAQTPGDSQGQSQGNSGQNAQGHHHHHHKKNNQDSSANSSGGGHGQSDNH